MREPSIPVSTTATWTPLPVSPAPDAAQHLDRVVSLVERQARDLDPAIEERPGRAERALTPSFVQGLVAADQHDATRHRRLSSLSGIDQGDDERVQDEEQGPVHLAPRNELERPAQREHP